MTREADISRWDWIAVIFVSSVAVFGIALVVAGFWLTVI